MTKENRKHLRLWVKALRSGKYKQTRHRLNRSKNGQLVSHCCLDVAHLVYQKATRQGYHNIDTGDFIVGGFKSGSFLNLKVANWLGFDDENPVCGKTRLACLNDSSHLSFSKIADRIEKHFLSKGGSK